MMFLVQNKHSPSSYHFESRITSLNYIHLRDKSCLHPTNSHIVQSMFLLLKKFSIILNHFSFNVMFGNASVNVELFDFLGVKKC